jgi:hypothetical protein
MLSCELNCNERGMNKCSEMLRGMTNQEKWLATRCDSSRLSSPYL